MDFLKRANPSARDEERLKFRFAWVNLWCRELWFGIGALRGWRKLHVSTNVSRRVYCFHIVNHITFDKKLIRLFLIEPVLASRSISWRGASLLLLVVDLVVVLAAQFARIISIDTDVEALAIGWMWIPFVLVASFRALEAVLEFLGNRLAIVSIGNCGPCTVSGSVVEVQAVGAFALAVLAVFARVENVANRLVGMGEDSVLPRTKFVVAFGRLCGEWKKFYRWIYAKKISIQILTQFSPIAAVHAKRLITLVRPIDLNVKDKAIGTELLGCHAIIAFDVFVALNGVRVDGSLITGTLEVGLLGACFNGGNEFALSLLIILCRFKHEKKRNSLRVPPT